MQTVLAGFNGVANCYSLHHYDTMHGDKRGVGLDMLQCIKEELGERGVKAVNKQLKDLQLLPGIRLPADGLSFSPWATADQLASLLQVLPPTLVKLPKAARLLPPPCG